MTDLKSTKYQMSADDMRMIAGGKRIEVVTSIEYYKVPCPEGFSVDSECYKTIAHITIYNGKKEVIGTRNDED